MNKTIVVDENRALFMYSNNEKFIFDNFFGVVGEDNATVVNFVFPKTVNGYSTNSLIKKLCFINKDGTLKPVIENNTISIPFAMTGYPTAKIWIEMYSENDELIWFSREKDIMFATHSDDSIIHIGERDRRQLAEALTNIMGVETTSQHFENITFPDFSAMTFAQLIEYIGNLRTFFELCMERVYYIAETPTAHKIDKLMSQLWDFSKDKLYGLRMTLTSAYREANGWTREQLLADPFIRPILERDFTDWDDFSTWVEQVCIHINALAVTNNTERLSDTLVAAFGTDPSSDFNALLGTITAVANRIYEEMGYVTGETPTELGELLAQIELLNPTLKAAIETATGEYIPGTPTFSELCQMITELHTDVEYVIGDDTFNVSEEGITYYDDEQESDVFFNLTLIDGKPAIEYEILTGGNENE